MSEFIITAKCAGTRARAGELRLAHGTVSTPVFMPVGTQGTVKSLAPWELEEFGARIILSNAYHLYLRPGIEIIKNAGGLHKFMGWSGPILTDSGGYQVFSMQQLRKVDDDAVLFRSHIDGGEHIFSPERCMAVEEAIGADIIMALDEPVAYPATEQEAGRAQARSDLWAARCRAAHPGEDQLLFGIVQGGVYPRLRELSARALMEIGFPGYAIGGLSVGEPKTETDEITSLCASILPEDKPRYLMGVGTPIDILRGIERGVDMFDCVLPTRMGRNGTAFTCQGRITVRNAEFKDDPRPIEAGCRCPACVHFSRAYLRHLVKSNEILGARMLSAHNVFFYLDLIREARRSIIENRFPEFKARVVEQMSLSERGI